MSYEFINYNLVCTNQNCISKHGTTPPGTPQSLRSVSGRASPSSLDDLTAAGSHFSFRPMKRPSVSATPSPPADFQAAIDALPKPVAGDLQAMREHMRQQEDILARAEARTMEITQHQTNKLNISQRFETDRNTQILDYMTFQSARDPKLFHVNSVGQFFCGACVEYLHVMRNKFEPSAAAAIEEEYRLLWLVLLIHPSSTLTQRETVPTLDSTIYAPFFSASLLSNEYETLLNKTVSGGGITNSLAKFIPQTRQICFYSTAFARAMQQLTKAPAQLTPTVFAELLQTYGKQIQQTLQHLNSDLEKAQTDARATQQKILQLSTRQNIFNSDNLLHLITCVVNHSVSPDSSTPRQRPVTVRNELGSQATVSSEIEHKDSSSSSSSSHTSYEEIPPFAVTQQIVSQITQQLNDPNTAAHMYREVAALHKDFSDLPFLQRDIIGFFKRVCCCCLRGENPEDVPLLPAHGNLLARGPNSFNWKRRTVGAHRQLGTWLVILIFLILLGVALLFKPFDIIPLPRIHW